LLSLSGSIYFFASLSRFERSPSFPTRTQSPRHTHLFPLLCPLAGLFHSGPTTLNTADNLACCCSFPPPIHMRYRSLVTPLLHSPPLPFSVFYHASPILSHPSPKQTHIIPSRWVLIDPSGWICGACCSKSEHCIIPESHSVSGGALTRSRLCQSRIEHRSRKLRLSQIIFFFIFGHYI